MFGFGKDAKAKEAAKFQYDAMIDISRAMVCWGIGREKVKWH